MHSTAEATPLQPARLAGHCVTRPSLATLGMHDSWLAYAAGPGLVATLNIVACDAPSLTVAPPADAPASQAVRRNTAENATATALWQSARLRPLENPDREELAFLHAHPSKNWLCAGTTQHGLYLTSLTHPLFTNATRLPLAATGELTYSACFLTHHPPHRPRPSAAATGGTFKDGRGGDDEEDILAFSSAIKARSGLCASRLSLWHMRDRSLLYRGSMEPMHALCAFPGEAALVGCAGQNVCYFAAYDPSLTSQQASHGSLEASLSTRYRMRVSLSRCTSVDELSGVEYVQCTVCPKRDGTAAELFLALTTGGLLVAFDRASSAVLRWMDTKVSPAIGLYATTELVLLAGNLVRLFGADRWEVRGKVRRESTPASTTGSCLTAEEKVYSAVLATSRHLVLFSRGGEWSVYMMGSPAEVNAMVTTAHGKSSRPSLRRCFHFAPVPAVTQEDLLWLLPSAPSSAWWGLWSPHELRLMTHEMCQVRTVPLASTCAAFHKETNALLVYDPATHSVVAYAAQDEWQECARLAMMNDDNTDRKITALCCSTTGSACAALCAVNSTVTLFTCQWQYESRGDDGDADAAVPRRTLQLSQCDANRYLAPRWQLYQLSYLGGHLHAVTAQGILVNLDTERELHCRGTPRALCAVGANAVVLSRDACEYYDTRIGELRLMRLPAQNLCHASYDAQSDLLAVGAAQLVLLYRLSTATVLYTVRSTGDGCGFRALALCTDVLQVRLLLCDERGVLKAYEVESSTAPFRSSARTPREHSHSTAATSVGSQASRLTSTLPMNLASHNIASQRVLRRAASAGAPSSRELSARLDALTSLFAQQKAGATGRAHHRHAGTATLLRRSRSGAGKIADKDNAVSHEPIAAVSLSTGSRSAESSRAASSERHVSGVAGDAVGAITTALPDSPLRPVARDGLVGLPHDPVRVSASAAVEVSALTVDPRSSSALSSLLRAAAVAANVELPRTPSLTPVEAGRNDGVLPSSPVLCVTTPRSLDAGAHGTAQPVSIIDNLTSRCEAKGCDRLVLQSDEDENDGRFFTSALDMNEVHATPTVSSAAEAGGGDGRGSHTTRMPASAWAATPLLPARVQSVLSSNSNVSTSSTLVVEQSRQLRESLRQWTTLLEHVSADMEASNMSTTEESASTAHGRPVVDESEAAELHELSDMLSNALRVLQQRQTLSQRSSSAPIPAEDGRSSSDEGPTTAAETSLLMRATPSESQGDLISVLVAEVGRIRQQNSRLERQNELILQKLSNTTTISSAH